MKLSIKRENLLTPLQIVSNAVEKRQTKPILSNILFNFKKDSLTLTATDLEIEVAVNVALTNDQESDVTIPARKLLDICKSIEPGSNLNLVIEQNDRAIVKTGKSRFLLSTLSAQDFPIVNVLAEESTFSIAQKDLKHLLEKTAFAMAQQDVRYYLNGLLLELDHQYIKCVATDGHRLAFCQLNLSNSDSNGPQQIIIPRKGVIELLKLLSDVDDQLEISLAPNHIKLVFDNISFISKLIDGRFPAYERVIPENLNNILLVDKETLRHALVRVAILSNEKYKGIRMLVKDSNLKLQAHNPENEEAEEELEVVYTGDDIELGFNVNYLLDVISVVESEQIQIAITDSENSVLITSPDEGQSKYVIMPMRL